MKMSKRKKVTWKIKEIEFCGFSPAEMCSTCEKVFTARHPRRQLCTPSSGHSNTQHSCYISTENSSDSTVWGVRLYARDNTRALCPSEWIQANASWFHSHSCLKTSVDLFLQRCHPGGAPRPMLSLKMDTKSSKVGAEWGDGWGLGGVRILGQKSYEGSASRGLIDDGASARRLNGRHGAIGRRRGCCQHVTCHMMGGEPFLYVGGGEHKKHLCACKCW